jgi:hypothetical protein
VPTDDGRKLTLSIILSGDAARQGNAGECRHDHAAGGDPQPRQHRQILRVLFSGERLCRARLHRHEHPPTDAPMVTKVGELYVGRQPQYLRGIANIKFAVEEMAVSDRWQIQDPVFPLEGSEVQDRSWRCSQ